MNCHQCQTPIESLANIATLNLSGEGAWGVGWCEKDIHLACLPLHVRSCRSCWQHNTGHILLADQRIQKENAEAEQVG